MSWTVHKLNFYCWAGLSLWILLDYQFYFTINFKMTLRTDFFPLKQPWKRWREIGFHKFKSFGTKLVLHAWVMRIQVLIYFMKILQNNCSTVQGIKKRNSDRLALCGRTSPPGSGPILVLVLVFSWIYFRLSIEFHWVRGDISAYYKAHVVTSYLKMWCRLNISKCS